MQKAVIEDATSHYFLGELWKQRDMLLPASPGSLQSRGFNISASAFEAQTHLTATEQSAMGFLSQCTASHAAKQPSIFLPKPFAKRKPTGSVHLWHGTEYRGTLCFPSPSSPLSFSIWSLGGVVRRLFFFFLWMLELVTRYSYPPRPLPDHFCTHCRDSKVPHL